MRDNNVELVGNLTRDIEYRVSPNGNGYARGGVAVNRRVNKGGDNWEDEPSFIDFVILDDQMAQNAAELPKGSRVVLSGWWQQRTVENEDGTKSWYHTLVVDEIAASLRWATVSIHKNEKKGTGNHQSQPRMDEQGRFADAYHDEEPF